MYHKNKLIFMFFLSMVGVLILPFCHSNTNKIRAYHSFLATDDFKKLKRSDQILKCASCHKQEYQNEIKGPHTNAYKMLSEHRDFVNSNKYKCSFYTDRVNVHFEECTGCHASQNLYETYLLNILEDRSKLVAHLLSISHPLPPKRDNELSRMTGIDCLNCHYDGNNLISLKLKLTKIDSTAASQTLPVITSNNITCYPCHADVFRTMNPGLAISRTGSVRCVNCHQEYNSAGNNTHYYFWKHDPVDKVNSKLFDMMDDLHFHIPPDQKDGEITWLNKTIPHDMSPGPEIILTCDVLDIDSNVLGTKTIRINKKKAFDTEMYEQLGNKTLYGIEGNEVNRGGDPRIYKMVLKNAEKVKFFRVSLIHKAQYWFPDSLGVLTARKVYPYQ